MNTQLFFIFDTHCPWSYATLPLVNEISASYPDMDIQLFHCARYQGDENISKKTLSDVEEMSGIVFSPSYMAKQTDAKDSTLTANISAWITQKIPAQALSFLNATMALHFEKGSPLTDAEELADLINEYKLSPPNKALSVNQLTKNAEIVLSDIIELQEIIGTEAIPALLLAIDDKLILLNHNLYLANPHAIVEAVKLELA